MTIKEALVRPEGHLFTSSMNGVKLLRDAEKEIKDASQQLFYDSKIFVLFEELVQELSETHPDIQANNIYITPEEKRKRNAKTAHYESLSEEKKRITMFSVTKYPNEKSLIQDHDGTLKVGWSYENIKKSDNDYPFRYTFNYIMAVPFPISKDIAIIGEASRRVSQGLWQSENGKKILEDAIVDAYRNPLKSSGPPGRV